MGPITENPSESPKIAKAMNNLVSKCNLIPVETILFLMSLATGMMGVTSKSLYLQRICEFEFRNDICSNLTEFPNEEQQVQKLAGIYSTYQSIIQSGPPILLAFIWGGLNDKLGSKKLFFIPLVGFFLESLIYYFLSFSPGTSPTLLLLGSIPVGITDGNVTFTISIYKLIVHYTNETERTFRLGFAEAAMLIGSTIGVISGAGLVADYGFSSVFLVSWMLEVIAIIYAILFLQNDSPLNSSETKIFSLSAIKEGVIVCFQKRPSRPIIVTLIIILGIRSFTFAGKSATEFLYTVFKFNWDQGIYSVFSMFDGIISALGVLGVSTLFSKILNINDSIIGTVCAASFALSCLVYGFASAGWMMYLGSAIQLASGMTIIIVRSLISQLVGSQDVGKALSFIAIPEQIIPFLANPFYNLIYVSTLGSFPGTVYLISALLYILVTCLYLFIFLKTRNRQMENYENLDNLVLEFGSNWLKQTALYH